jgi:hypothetical protein
MLKKRKSFIAAAINSFATFILALTLSIAFSVPASAAKYFVNPQLGDVKPEDKVTVASPKPVQIIYEFQTNGVTNARATGFTKPIFVARLKSEGVFSDVVDTPVNSGAILSVVFNNVAEAGAAGQGFRTGLTFGLVGLFVTDNYVVTINYIPATGKTPISKSIQHALHVKMGNKKVEDPGIPVRNANEAVTMVLQQVASHAANQLAKDPAFLGLDVSVPTVPAVPPSLGTAVTPSPTTIVTPPPAGT